MKVKTISSKQMWQSPDRTKTIWRVALGADNGKIYALKTFSPKIAAVGFRGDVESYVKDAKNGAVDRFVRQKPGAKPAAKPGESRDDLIRAEWAIGQAINLASATMDREQITMPIIESYARDLFTTVGRVQAA